MKRDFCFLLITLIFGLACTPDHSIKVVADSNQIVSDPIIGAGVQWSAYPHADSETAEWGPLMTDEKWNEVYRRLDYIKPNIIRVMDQASWRYFTGLEKDGKTPVIDFTTQEVQSLYKVLDYCEKNNITVVFGEWGAPGLWGVEGNIHKADDPRWIHMITEYLKHLILEKGYTCLKYYNLVNEPDGYWASTDGDWDQWKRGVKLLHQSLIENGLSDKIQIAGPDAIPGYYNSKSKYNGEQWMVESVKQLNPILGCYDVHSYPSGKSVRSGEFSELYRPLVQLADSVGKPFILGELGLKYKGELEKKNRALGEADPYAGPDDSNMFVYDFFYGVDVADALIQSLNVGVDGIIAWDLDDAMHTVGDKGEKSQLKRWGMWNILGTEICNNPEDEKIRPWFYPWSLMSRYFPAGSQIIKTTQPSQEGLRIVSGVNGDQLTIAVVNNSSQAHEVSYEMLNANKDYQLKKYSYTEENRLVDENDFPIPSKEGISFTRNKKLKIEVAANSFLLFTTYDF